MLKQKFSFMILLCLLVIQCGDDKVSDEKKTAPESSVEKNFSLKCLEESNDQLSLASHTSDLFTYVRLLAVEGSRCSWTDSEIYQLAEYIEVRS